MRSAAELLAVKEGTGRTVSVVLPALNEEGTVGTVVATLRRELVDRVPLVDELVVIDSGSTDRTAAVAREAGAAVVAVSDVAPSYGTVPGKGDALWKSLLVTTGDNVVFLDADLEEVDATFVTGLCEPLLTDPGTAYVKAFYDRPLRMEAGVTPSGGGRVTELVARPLLNLYWPELAGVIQPLSGEYGGRREVLESVPFASGYGVEIGLLIDIARMVGIDAVVQVDLGRRVHRHHPDLVLGRMAAEVLQAALYRLEGFPVASTPANHHVTQFGRDGDGFVPTVHEVVLSERPPAATVPEPVRRHARSLLARG